MIRVESHPVPAPASRVQPESSLDARHASLSPAEQSPRGHSVEITATSQIVAEPVEADQAAGSDPAPVVAPGGAGRRPRRRKRTLLERIDAFISRLSTRNNFWHRVCSMIWLPYAFRSGIQMKRVDATTFTAILPFRRFNRNWYNAMAGAALLGNAEIAGGMYVFGVAGGDYTVVCKNLNYTFLRPCFGPAVYRIKPQEDLNALVAAGGEFNITLDMDVVQQVRIPGKRDKRVGRTVVTFHVTPKSHHKDKKKRRQSAAEVPELPAVAPDATAALD
jgi:hypothetical protein